VPRLEGIANLGDIIALDRGLEAHWLTELAEDGTAIRYTLGDLISEANAIGRGLIGRGLAPGDRVGLLAGNSARFLIAYFGIMRAGLCAVPINFKVPAHTVAHILTDADVRLTLTDGEHAALLSEGHTRFDIDRDADWKALSDPGPLDIADVAPEDFANILYTSGSTGLPKGVPLTHGGYLYSLKAILAAVPEPWQARALVAAPLYHMNGLFFSKMVLAGGIEQVLMRKFSARGYLEAIEAERCTYLTAIPTMMALAMRETDLIDRLDFSSVDSITIGSSPVTVDLMKEIQAVFPDAHIAISYGTTESGPTAFRPHPDGRPTPWPALGVASDRAEIKLVGGTEEEGTLWVRSPVVMPGYLNMPEKTAERLNDGWYDTGDVMRRDADGFYYFVDRADDMFVCGGENVHPGDVEAMLLTHPDVSEAAVVPVPDAIKGQLPAAFIVPRPGVEPTVAAIKDYALKNGPAYQHPRFVEFVDALPWQGTNKVDRKVLKERAKAFSRDIEAKDMEQAG